MCSSFKILIFIIFPLFLFYVAQSEDEHGRPARKRGPVGFDQDVRSDVSHSVAAFFFVICLVVKIGMSDHLKCSFCRLTS